MKLNINQLNEAVNKLKKPKFVLTEAKSKKKTVLTEERFNELVENILNEVENPYTNLKFVDELCADTPLSEDNISTIKTLIWENFSVEGGKSGKKVRNYLLENLMSAKFLGLKSDTRTILGKIKSQVDADLKEGKELSETAKTLQLPLNLLEEVIAKNRYLKEHKQTKGRNQEFLNIIESYKYFSEQDIIELYEKIAEMMEYDDEYVPPIPPEEGLDDEQVPYTDELKGLKDRQKDYRPTWDDEVERSEISRKSSPEGVISKAVDTVKFKQDSGDFPSLGESEDDEAYGSTEDITDFFTNDPDAEPFDPEAGEFDKKQSHNVYKRKTVDRNSDEKIDEDEQMWTENDYLSELEELLKQ